MACCREDHHGRVVLWEEVLVVKRPGLNLCLDQYNHQSPSRRRAFIFLIPAVTAEGDVLNTKK